MPRAKPQEPDHLRKYRSMRDFKKTPEPDGATIEPSPEKPRFVVQEHHATALHWDFRLERDGVLVSWAVPKGIPPDPKVNHLAVQTEDHPLDYYNFEGDIPEREYGGGSVILWDQGWYETVKFLDREVMVVLHGQRLRGKYVLFKTGGKNWMIHRMDPPDDPTREPMPKQVRPMLAKLAEMPPDDNRYAFEVKWDGVRAVVYSSGGRLRIESRNLLDLTAQFPDFRALGEQLGAHEAVLDGEIVAFDAAGRPSFERLQSRLGLTSTAVVRRKMTEIPVVFVLFDLLYLDGHSAMGLPYTDRRKLLESLALDGPSWKTPAYHAGDGNAMLEAAKAQDLEGVMAKRLDSPYEPGKRTGAWLKVKHFNRQEVVVGGFTRGEGARHRLGALLVGYYDSEEAGSTESGRPRRFHYAGKVGTGFTDEMLERLVSLLEPLRRETSPFETGSPEKGAVFVEPRLVVEVDYREWTQSGMLRHPVFKGLRNDKDPRDVTRESVT